jgi:hypothetical protein
MPDSARVFAPCSITVPIFRLLSKGPPERIAVYELVLHSLKFRDFSSDREKDQE